MAYDFNDRISLGGAFVFATGSTLTVPNAFYQFEQQIITEYGSRNGLRLVPYHRADVALTINGKTHRKKENIEGEFESIKKKIVSTWVISVYNLYNRANPYFIYLSTSGSLSGGTLSTKANQVSLFPILPSVTWNFKF